MLGLHWGYITDKNMETTIMGLGRWEWKRCLWVAALQGFRGVALANFCWFQEVRPPPPHATYPFRLMSNFQKNESERKETEASGAGVRSPGFVP